MLLMGVAFVGLSMAPAAEGALTGQFTFDDNTAGANTNNSAYTEQDTTHDLTKKNFTDFSDFYTESGAPVPSGTQYAGDFDGSDDYLQTTGNATTPLGGLTYTARNGITLSTWVNSDAVRSNTSSGRAGLIGKRNSLTQYFLSVDPGESGTGDTNRFSFYLKSSAGNTVEFQTKDSYSINTWHHVTAVLDRNHASNTDDSATIYVDGKVEGTADADMLYYWSEQRTPVRVGTGKVTFPASSIGYFDGQLDELRIYNTPLSQSQIQTLVPEPASLVLLGLGGVMLLGRRRRSACAISSPTNSEI